ncbi:MAG: ComEC/Rec2 family competence protein [bacterium]
MSLSHRFPRFTRAAEAIGRQHQRQPLLAVAGLFLLGIVCGYRWGAWPVAVGGAVVCSQLLVWWRGRTLQKAGIAAVLVFLLGWSDAAWNDAGRLREAERLKESESRQTFVCRVGPEVVVTPLQGEAAKFTFHAEHLRNAEGRRMFHYLPVEVNWFGARRSELTLAPQPGEVWRLTGRAAVKKGRDGRLALTVNTGEERARKLTDADLGAWLVRISHARRQAARRLIIGIEDWGVVPALNQAMMLGCRNEIPRDMRRVFSNSGTIHVFAISGLNIALVAALLIVLVSAFGVPRPYWVLGVAPLLIFYTFASGAQPSAVRACLMALIYFAAPLFGRKANGIAALSGTALLVYAYAPCLVYNIGCTLSFAVMGGLVVFCQPFCAIGRALCRAGLLEQRACLFKQAGNPAAERRVKLVLFVIRAIVNSVAVSLAAWLASLPLTAYYFARFTPGGFFANLVIAPCAFLVMVGGCLGLAASFVSDWLASCFNHAAGFFTVIMIRTAEITVSYDWANFRITRWEPWLVWVWFLVLAACAAWLRVRRPADGLAWLDGVEPQESKL